MTVPRKPRLLDLFAGAGGSAVGYARAGFEVVGVDHVAQPHYPFPRYQDNALKVLADLVADPIARSEWAAIHASPPCQFATQMSARWRVKGDTLANEHVNLLTPTRELLKAIGLPYVIENVPGARQYMNPTLILHGGMFGLGVHRPRLFESNVLLLAPTAPRTPEPIGVYGRFADGRRLWTRLNGNGKKRSEIRAAKDIDQAREAMGISWMDWPEIKEAIPPAYTEHIGRQLIGALESVA